MNNLLYNLAKYFKKQGFSDELLAINNIIKNADLNALRDNLQVLNDILIEKGEVPLDLNSSNQVYGLGKLLMYCLSSDLNIGKLANLIWQDYQNLKSIIELSIEVLPKEEIFEIIIEIIKFIVIKYPVSFNDYYLETRLSELYNQIEYLKKNPNDDSGFEIIDRIRQDFRDSAGLLGEINEEDDALYTVSKLCYYILNLKNMKNNLHSSIYNLFEDYPEYINYCLKLFKSKITPQKIKEFIDNSNKMEPQELSTKNIADSNSFRRILENSFSFLRGDFEEYDNNSDENFEDHRNETLRHEEIIFNIAKNPNTKFEDLDFILENKDLLQYEEADLMVAKNPNTSLETLLKIIQPNTWPPKGNYAPKVYDAAIQNPKYINYQKDLARKQEIQDEIKAMNEETPSGKYIK